MRWVRRVMKNAIDRGLMLPTRFAGDYPTRVAVAVKAREITV